MVRLLAIAGLFATACCGSQRDDQLQRDGQALAEINAVLEAHDEELMAIPGVVGVYVGLMSDDETPCLKVMVVERTQELVEQLPETLDGHPVIVEETGVIRPLKEP